MVYVGLNVSVARTVVCILYTVGRVVREQSVASTPEVIAAIIRASGDGVERICLEAGINSAWIARGLPDAGLPVIVIDATHAAAALKTDFRNKNRQERCRRHHRSHAGQQVPGRIGEVGFVPARPGPADGARATAPAVVWCAQRHLVDPAGGGSEAAEAGQPGLSSAGAPIT